MAPWKCPGLLVQGKSNERDLRGRLDKETVAVDTLGYDQENGGLGSIRRLNDASAHLRALCREREDEPTEAVESLRLDGLAVLNPAGIKPTAQQVELAHSTINRTDLVSRILPPLANSMSAVLWHLRRKQKRCKQQSQEVVTMPTLTRASLDGLSWKSLG